MEENIRYGFLDQIPVAFFQPSKYKEFLPVKKRFLIGFILLITFFSVLLEYIIPFGAWEVSVGGLENLVTNGIPAFTLKDGTFNIASPISFELNGALQVKADSGVEKYKEKDLDDAIVEEILIAKENMIVKHSGMVYDVDLDDLDYTVTNETLVELLPAIKLALAISFILGFIINMGAYMIVALFFALICKGRIRSLEGEKVPLGVAFLFAIFARAPFMLIGDLNICLGTKIDSMWIMIFGVFFSIHYILRAEMFYFGLDKKKGDSVQ